MLGAVFVDADKSHLQKAQLLCEANGVSVTGFSDALAYLKSPTFSEPHIAVLDLKKTGCDGLDIIRSACSNSGALYVFAMTADIDLKRVVAATRAGIADVLKKPIAVGEIVAAAKRGGMPASDDLRPDAEAAIDLLTRRERQVLDHLRKGHSTKPVAEKLDVSVRTIESHKARLYSKFGVRGAC